MVPGPSFAFLMPEFWFSMVWILTFYGLNSDFLRSEFWLSTVWILTFYGLSSDFLWSSSDFLRSEFWISMVRPFLRFKSYNVTGKVFSVFLRCYRMLYYFLLTLPSREFLRATKFSTATVLDSLTSSQAGSWKETAPKIHHCCVHRDRTDY